MKRIGNLWSELLAFGNLLRAAKQSARGKRFHPAVLAYHARLEAELFELQAALREQRWGPGRFHTFTIHDPKRRIICAAPYRDRVVHHALVNILEPIWERCFYHDSHASRKGKGTHAAMRRCQVFARRHRWVWKADIRHFFPSIDHLILKQRIRRKIKDPDVLWLADTLIDHSPWPSEPPTALADLDCRHARTRRRGLPIGNQTSQFFANVYLDPLDHFIKDRLRLPGYIRYVDDFVVFADDKAGLHETRKRVTEFLATLRLVLHPSKNVIFPVRQGIRFLGYRVWPGHVKLVAENVYRFRRRLRKLVNRYFAQQIEGTELVRRVMSWIGHACQADTVRLRQRLLEEHLYRRMSAG